MNVQPKSEAVRLEKLLQQQIKRQAEFDQADIAVRVQGRVAYITGCVGGLRHKRLAGEMAAHFEGIGTVVNMLRVAPMVHVDDDKLREHILEAFAGNWRVNETSVLVEVGHGVVHLRGVAKSMAELCACEEEAGSTPGVDRVVSHLQLRSERPRTEREVGQDILDGLTECLGLSPGAVHVTSYDGVFRLSGVVANDRVKSAAEAIACWTPSVTEVVNDLAVIPLNHTPKPSDARDQRTTMAAEP